MEDTLKKEIEAIVASIFSEKEEGDKIQKVEDELLKASTTIEALNTSLEEANTEIDSKVAELSTKADETTDLTSKLEAAKEEVESSKTKLTETEEKLVEAEAKLIEIEKDRVAEIRMAELEDSDVCIGKVETQKSKVREMIEEDFVEYKKELVSIKEAVLAKLETSNQQDKDADNSNDKDGDIDDKEGTPLANIDSAENASAALNFELSQDDDVITKYSKLGQAMAENMVKK